MAEDVNSCNFSGNLTREPELRMTTNGTAILSFSVAVNSRRKVNGEWQDVASYPRMVMFGRRAEALSAYLHKGMKVFVTCSLQESAYEKDGRSTRSTEFIVDKLVMTGRKAEPEYKVEISDEELPF